MSRFTLKDVVVSGKEVVCDRFLKLSQITFKHRLFDGGWGEDTVRECLQCYPAVTVLPYDPQADTVVLNEQLRTGPLIAGSSYPWILEVIAGMQDRPEEQPERVARRELWEEAGLEAQELELMASFFVSPGISDEYVHAYIACVNSEGAHHRIHGVTAEHEDIRNITLGREEALTLLAEGKINNVVTIMSLQYLALHAQRLQAQWSHHDR